MKSNAKSMSSGDVESIQATGVQHSSKTEDLEWLKIPLPERLAVGARLVAVRGQSTQAEFAEFIGVHKNTVGRYEKGGRGPRASLIYHLARNGGVNINWLMTGAGPMLVNAPAEADEAAARLRPELEEIGPGLRRKMEVLGIMPRHRVAEPATPYAPDGASGAADVWSASRTLPADQVLVPRYNLRAAAERGHIDTDADLIGYYGYGDAWVRGNLKADPAHLCVGIVVGDSMEPDLYDGEEMLVDLSVNQYVGDAIYLVRFESSLMIKQLQRVLGGTLRLVSRNDRYEAQTVHDRGDLLGVDFSVIGRVLGKPKFIKL